MDARVIASRLMAETLPGTYSQKSDLYPDLKKALIAAAGPSAVVHVERQDHGAIRSVSAFSQAWRPDGAIQMEGRRIGVEAKLLHRSRESDSIAAAVLQGMVLSLEYDEALLVLVATEDTAPFTSRERAMLDRLWDLGRIAWAYVPVRGTVPVETPVPSSAVEEATTDRKVGEQATRGIRKWIQRAVNDYPRVLDAAITEASQGLIRGPVQWKSPMRHDGFAEYCDERALKLIGAKLERRTFSSFWPPHGPTWDALGLTTDGMPILVEARAFSEESARPARNVSPESWKLIGASLGETQRALGIAPRDWTGPHFRYGLRLAHLHLLRNLNDVPAWLVFLHLTGYEEVTGPRTEEEWEAARSGIRSALGIEPKALPCVVDLCLDVRKLGAVPGIPSERLVR